MRKRNKKGMFEKIGKNPIDYVNGYAVIWATDKEGNKKTGYKVDLDDVEKVLAFRWSVSTDGYAKHRSIKMHRLIMNASKGQLVDHINQDVTDNRKENLRFVSPSLNQRNSNKTKAKSGHKHITKWNNCYAVQLRCRGERYYIGNLKTLEEAIKARDTLYNKINYFSE